MHEGGISWYMNSCKNGFIVGNIISENTANDSGGGLNVLHVLVIKNNYILNNHAGFDGGGIILLADEQIPCYIRNNVICGNTGGSGGGVYFDHGLYYFVNNTVTDNVAAAYYGGGLYICPWANVLIRNCIIWGNQAAMEDDEIYWDTYPDIQYSDIGGGWPGPGNLDADPRFVDPANGDYHLQYGSPCIDAGTRRVPGGLPTTDIEGDPRMAGSAPDMGADEFSTHLYFVGVPSPGSLMTLKIIGDPGTDPVGLFFSMEVLHTPLNTNYGTWYLKFPVYGPLLLGPVPSNGVILFYGILPPDIQGPYDLNFQALVMNELTNLTVMEVE